MKYIKYLPRVVTFKLDWISFLLVEQVEEINVIPQLPTTKVILSHVAVYMQRMMYGLTLLIGGHAV